MGFQALFSQGVVYGSNADQPAWNRVKNTIKMSEIERRVIDGERWSKFIGWLRNLQVRAAASHFLFFNHFMGILLSERHGEEYNSLGLGSDGESIVCRLFVAGKVTESNCTFSSSEMCLCFK